MTYISFEIKHDETLILILGNLPGIPPEEGENKPGGEGTGGDETEKPGEGENKPGGEGIGGDETEKPGEGENKPGEKEEKKDETQKPDNTENKNDISNNGNNNINGNTTKNKDLEETIQNKDNIKSSIRVLPRTGSDYFEFKVIFIDLFIIMIFISTVVIYAYLKEKADCKLNSPHI